jgi:hypothetical protein
MLNHVFERDGQHREYLTAHAVRLEDGRISAWEERDLHFISREVRETRTFSRNQRVRPPD